MSFTEMMGAVVRLAPAVPLGAGSVVKASFAAELAETVMAVEV